MIRIPKTRSKYGNVKTVIDDITFDSHLEARRYMEIKMLKSAGEIIAFEVHPEFMLQESFKHGGKTIRAITYTGDFLLVYPDGHRVIEDTKGFMTEPSKIRIKLLLKRYPDIEFRLVKKVRR